MCVQIPCGYSLQTIIKALAVFEIVLSLICLILSGVFAVLCFSSPLHLLSVFNYADHALRLGQSPSSTTTYLGLPLPLGLDSNSNWTSTVDDFIANESNATTNKTEQLELQLQNNSNSTLTLRMNPVDSIELVDEEIDDNLQAIEDFEGPGPDDFLRFMNAKSSFQVSVVAVVLVYFLCGLTLAVLLLSAAQERNPQKLTIWMLLQTLAHVIRLILVILLIYWMTDTEKRLDVVLCFLLMNFYSLTVFSIIRGHRQEILALYKRNNRATHLHMRAAVNDPGVLKQRFIRNV